MGETSKLLSERFGKIMQDRQRVSVNRSDASVSYSKQLDSAITASKIAALSYSEFVELVADNPDEKIKLKMFHAEILTMLINRPKKSADIKTFLSYIMS
jgi:hypothetical protein